MIALDVIKTAFGSTPASPNWNPAADLNGDGIVNGADFSLWLEQKAVEETSAAAVVETQPKQSFFRLNNPMLWLAVLGILAVVGSKKKG